MLKPKFQTQVILTSASLSSTSRPSRSFPGLAFIHLYTQKRQASSLCSYEEKFINIKLVNLSAIANIKMLIINLRKRDGLGYLLVSEASLWVQPAKATSIQRGLLVKSNVIECIEGSGQSCSVGKQSRQGHMVSEGSRSKCCCLCNVQFICSCASNRTMVPQRHPRPHAIVARGTVQLILN